MGCGREVQWKNSGGLCWPINAEICESLNFIILSFSIQKAIMCVFSLILSERRRKGIPFRRKIRDLFPSRNFFSNCFKILATQLTILSPQLVFIWQSSDPSTDLRWISNLSLRPHTPPIVSDRTGVEMRRGNGANHQTAKLHAEHKLVLLVITAAEAGLRCTCCHAVRDTDEH